MERIAVVTTETGEVFIWREDVPTTSKSKSTLLFMTAKMHTSKAVYQTESEVFLAFAHLPILRTVPAGKSLSTFE
jgi:hypothetical protein